MIHHLHPINISVSLWHTKHWPGLTTARTRQLAQSLPIRASELSLKDKKVEWGRQRKKLLRCKGTKLHGIPRQQEWSTVWVSTAEQEQTRDLQAVTHKPQDTHESGEGQAWHWDHRCQSIQWRQWPPWPSVSYRDLLLVSQENAFELSSSRHPGYTFAEELRRTRRKSCRRRPM